MLLFIPPCERGAGRAGRAGRGVVLAGCWPVAPARGGLWEQMFPVTALGNRNREQCYRIQSQGTGTRNIVPKYRVKERERERTERSVPRVWEQMLREHEYGTPHPENKRRQGGRTKNKNTHAF